MTYTTTAKTEQLRGIFNTDHFSPDTSFVITITPVTDAQAEEIEFKSLKGIAGKPLTLDDVRKERLNL